MAMYVATAADGDTIKPRQVEYHVGESFKAVRDKLNVTGKVTIQADGDELTEILDQFENIPYSNETRVQIWRGEFARFIYDNFKGK